MLPVLLFGVARPIWSNWSELGEFHAESTTGRRLQLLGNHCSNRSYGF
jgi:hypothetical protein